MLSPGGSGRAGGVALELGPYRVRTCPSAHLRHFPEPGFGGALRTALGALVPVAESCPACGAAATGEPTTTRVTGRPVVPQGEPRPVQVTVDVPAHVCACGTVWVTPDVDDDLSDALIAAFLGLRP